jgi:hypothetical protein
MDYGLQMYSSVISVQFVCRKIDNLISRVASLIDVCDWIPGRGKNLLYRNAREVTFILKHSAKYNFSQVQYKLPDDGRRPKNIVVIFCVYFNVNFKPFQV